MHVRQAAYALRMGLAVTAGLYLSLWLRLENPYWAPTTILVVEGLNYGAVSDKLFKRLAGNIAGTLSGLLLIALFAQTGPVYALACGSFTMLAAYAMMETRHPHFWRWTLIAAALVTFTRVNAPTLAFYLAMDRVCGVAIGLVAAALSHQLIAPRYAGEDYRNHMAGFLIQLADLATRRAEQARQKEFPPLLQPGDLVGRVTLLRDELHHACRDTEAFRRTRISHERMLDHLDKLATQLTLICIEPPAEPFSLESRTISATRLIALARRVARLRAFPTHPASPLPQGEDDDRTDSMAGQGTPGPWCTLITLAHDAMDRLEDETRQPPLCEGSNPALASRNRPLRQEDVSGGPFHNAWKALLAGAATTLGMMLWRVTGWPGGAAIPLLATIQVIFSTAGPALTLSFLVVVQAIALTLSALLLFFVLPAIHSTEFFFIVIALLFTFWGWLMHAPNPRVRGLGMLVGTLMNSCVYSYTATMASFTVVAAYAWSIIGATLVSGLLVGIFYPLSPRHRFSRHASGCFQEIDRALSASPGEAERAFHTARQHAKQMLAWARRATHAMAPADTRHAALAALAAGCLSTTLQHEARRGRPDAAPADRAPNALLHIYNAHAGHLPWLRIEADTAITRSQPGTADINPVDTRQEAIYI